MPAHFSDLVQVLQENVAGLNYCKGPKPPIIMKWCGHVSVFLVWIKYKPSHIIGWSALVIQNARILDFIHDISSSYTERSNIRLYTWYI